MTWDAIVVGSGFGGAVSAARLAERGLRVLVLERGPWWGPGAEGQPTPVSRQFPRGLLGIRKLLRNVRWTRGSRSREFMVHRDGLVEWHAFAQTHAFVASGVGGGSLIYTNMQYQPDDEFFAAFPPELTADELRPYYDRVRAVLQPSPIPQPPPKAVAFERALAAGGMGGPESPDLAVAWGANPDVAEPVVNAAGRTQSTCINVGHCILGCEYGAKTTLDLTYIPLALRHGAEVRALCEVDAIGKTAGGYTAAWTDRSSGRRWRATAPRLVLAAGTLGTVRLLLDARDRARSLPDLPAILGTGFSTNGDLLSLVQRPQHPPHADRGPAITATARFPGQGRHRFMLGEAGLPLAALPLPGLLRRRLGRSVALFGMGREQASADLMLAGAGLRTTASRDRDPGLYDAMERASAAIAAGYRPRRALLSVPRGPGRGALLTVHPVGGAAIGRTALDGVVDHTGQVFGHPGLFVADGSLYPAAPGLPPSMTIAALAERQAELMA